MSIEKKEIVRGYKAFEVGLKCRDMQYELGKDFTIEGKIKLCGHGFHFCRSLGDVYEFYSFGSVVAEIEAFGEVIDDEDGKKSVTNGIRLIRILDAEKEARANKNSSSTGYLNSGNLNSGNKNSGNLNSGNKNSGDWNSGNKNSGDLNSGNLNSGNWNSGNKNSGNWNSGNKNSGNWNSGNKNSGNWNSGNWNSGFFNTITPEEILIFNKVCTRSDWEKADKPYFMYFSLTEWIEFSDMTDEEKTQQPEAKTTGGYLKKKDYKEAWQEAWKKSNKSEKEQVEKLPNFDKKVFYEITGIKI